jgi:hypothetical protein
VEETVYRTVLGDILDDLSSAISIRDEKFQEALEVANELELCGKQQPVDKPPRTFLFCLQGFSE